MSFWFVILAAIALILSAFALGRGGHFSQRILSEPGIPFRGPHPAEGGIRSRFRRPVVRRLSTDERERYLVAWHSTSARFVDDPAQAISEADRLLADIMEARGFPVLDFDAAAIGLATDHPALAEHYRPARRIALQSEAGSASTEALHRGMTHFKVMLDELLDRGGRPSFSGF
ncbi:MAG: hypothetical protein ACREAA_11275 [Candidatus Polarisedimenticolia bacterium]